MSSHDASRPTCNFAWARWIAAYAALTFAILFVDTAMNHHDVIHEVRWSWTPLIFAPLAFLACVWAIVCPRAPLPLAASACSL